MAATTGALGGAAGALVIVVDFVDFPFGTWRGGKWAPYAEDIEKCVITSEASEASCTIMGRRRQSIVDLCQDSLDFCFLLASCNSPTDRSPDRPTLFFSIGIGEAGS